MQLSPAKQLTTDRKCIREFMAGVRACENSIGNPENGLVEGCGIYIAERK